MAYGFKDDKTKEPLKKIIYTHQTTGQTWAQELGVLWNNVRLYVHHKKEYELIITNSSGTECEIFHQMSNSNEEQFHFTSAEAYGYGVTGFYIHTISPKEKYYDTITVSVSGSSMTPEYVNKATQTAPAGRKMIFIELGSISE